MGALCLVLVLLFSTLCLSMFLNVFLMSCDSQCSVALPRGDVGWSLVCDCSITCF